MITDQDILRLIKNSESQAEREVDPGSRKRKSASSIDDSSCRANH